jgi:hypothetical protein
MFAPFVVLAVLPWLPPNPLGPGSRHALAYYLKTGDVSVCREAESEMEEYLSGLRKNADRDAKDILTMRRLIALIPQQFDDQTLFNIAERLRKWGESAVPMLRQSLGLQFQLHGLRLVRWGVGLARPFWKLCQAATKGPMIRPPTKGPRR